MSQKKKLIERFCLLPKDFTYDELKTMLESMGYKEDTKPNGSRVRFYNQKLDSLILLHKPHPRNIVTSGALKDVKEKLELEGLI